MIPELLGPYEWVTKEPTTKGIAEAARHFGCGHFIAQGVALAIAYNRARPDMTSCPHRRVRANGRLGRCVRRAGHDGDHRTLLLSLADSRAILAGMRRVVEPDPIPEVTHG